MKPPETLTETAGEWRRDVHHVIRCLCGHDRNEHRHDMKTTSPCHVGGCGCQFMRPDVIVHFEHRTVIEPIRETS